MAKLQDVAREAGVSISTVSRVINEPDLVQESTRVRVQAAIRLLGYEPSRVARRLRTESGRTNLLGLVIPDIQNPFFADLARGVEDVAQQQGFMVFLCNSDENPEKERLYLNLMRAEAVDGVILPPISETDEVAIELVQDGIPVVCVDRRLARVRVDTVVVDNVRGAYEATEHLIQNGHRRIGFIEGLPRLSTSRERVEGYRKAIRHHGIGFNPALVRPGNSRQESGRALADELLALEEPPTALFIGNNLMTLGALEAIHSRKLRIPEDVGVVSFDDMPWSLAFPAPLTAVRQPGYEMGSRATELLLQRLSNPHRSTVEIVLQPELIVRKSCGADMQAVAPLVPEPSAMPRPATLAVLPAPAAQRTPGAWRR